MANRLANAKSPYLQQHASNPVDWYEWGEEALERARREEKPIFLSIGYSACHWCHVMERESFEDPQIAQLLNQHFVCIKVDREERPDLDQIYMAAVQMMTGRGGWPLSVFLTPEREPFFGGTYWPPRRRMGMPGFDEILQAVIDAWEHRRELARQQARELTSRIAQRIPDSPVVAGELNEELLHQAATQLRSQFDSRHGGFGPAPKFPHATDLRLLLRIACRSTQWELLQIATVTLKKMAAGGIRDHLGGGFARYSVDDRWLVPHFEKMLYDNALLAEAYLETFQLTGDEQLAQVARETLSYVLERMTDSRGGYFSSEDADSEGEEGKYYVWSYEEIIEALPPDIADRFCQVYGVTPEGNFEGRNILNLHRPLEETAHVNGWDVGQLRTQIAQAKTLLLQVRQQRVPPARDEKILTSWNAMMIRAMAAAGRALEEDAFVESAVKGATFLRDHMRRPDGLLWHCWRDGTAYLDAYLDDYAALADALLVLYEATWDEQWLEWTAELLTVMQERFSSPSGLLFYTAGQQADQIARLPDLQDGSVPSGNSMAATALLRYASLAHNVAFADAAEKILLTAGRWMEQAPMAMGQMLIALDWYLGPNQQVVVVGPRDESAVGDLLARLGRVFLPRTVCAYRADPAIGRPVLDAIFAGKGQLAPPPTVYLCQNFVCEAPVSGADEALSLLNQLVPRVTG